MSQIASKPLLYNVLLHNWKACCANNVVFHGAIHDDVKTGEILFACDMMVMPGYLGLSVNHAFCFDCPVMSFEQQKNGPFHSPEVEYVINNKTGFRRMVKAL